VQAQLVQAQLVQAPRSWALQRTGWRRSGPASRRSAVAAAWPLASAARHEQQPPSRPCMCCTAPLRCITNPERRDTASLRSVLDQLAWQHAVEPAAARRPACAAPCRSAEAAGARPHRSCAAPCRPGNHASAYAGRKVLSRAFRSRSIASQPAAAAACCSLPAARCLLPAACCPLPAARGLPACCLLQGPQEHWLAPIARALREPTDSCQFGVGEGGAAAAGQAANAHQVLHPPPMASCSQPSTPLWSQVARLLSGDMLVEERPMRRPMHSSYTPAVRGGRARAPGRQPHGGGPPGQGE
jgi:hypothetical protein